MFLINGHKQESLAVSDRATQFGDGCFTTARVIDGKVSLLSAHIQRLQDACQRLMISCDFWPQLEQEMKTLAAEQQNGVLKVVISRGSGGRGYSTLNSGPATRILSVTAYPAHYDRLRNEGMTLALSPVRLGRNPHLAGIKHLNRLEQVLIRSHLEQTNADEALVLDSEGWVTECCAANLFWRKGNVVYTPRLDQAGVNGIMRQFCIRLLAQSSYQLVEVQASLEESLQADELLHDGEAIQVVLSSQASAEFHGDAFMLYRRMRSINPSPYMFFMRLPEVTLFGSSPELMVRCTDGKLQLSPIAGTRRRGRDDEEDAALAADLLKDPKECSEHVMLVDLGRNDLGRVAKPGSVKLERLMEIERFSHVMHMTSRVTAQVNDGLDVLDILGAAFPAGTVSGAPKVRAMEILAEEEPLPRGPYAGCIGWLGLDKNGVHMDSGITIRSMWVKDGRIHWQTGAGIVYDSDPAAEWQECMNKGKIIDVILKGEDHVSVH